MNPMKNKSGWLKSWRIFPTNIKIQKGGEAFAICKKCGHKQKVIFAFGDMMECNAMCYRCNRFRFFKRIKTQTP